MKTTLENLTEKVRENRLRNLAKNIVQYQNFKTSSIISKIDNAGYTESTLRFYIDKGIGYIKNGIKVRQLGFFSDYIDEYLKQHIQPYTPSNTDRRIIINRKKDKVQKYKKENTIPVENVLQKINETIVNKKSITNNKVKYLYAVKMNKNIRLQDSIIEAKAFLDGLSFMGNTDAKIVKITCEEV